jgi:hypothetical protein
MDEVGRFSIRTDSPEKSLHEIEFLESQTASEDKDPELIRFEGPSFRVSPPSGKNFFRVRRIGEKESKGFWTEVLPVRSFLNFPSISEPVSVPKVKTDSAFIELEKEGKPVLFLNGDRINVSPAAKSQSSVGIDKSYYRINGGDWQVAQKDGIRIFADGEYQMDYYSVDRVGNKETPKTVYFIVDHQAPFTRLNFLGNRSQDSQFQYISGETEIELSAFDSVSGLEKTFYRFRCNSGQESKFSVYEKPIRIKDPMEYCGSGFQIQYYSLDRVGNQEDLRIFLFSYIP